MDTRSPWSTPSKSEYGEGFIEVKDTEEEEEEEAEDVIQINLERQKVICYNHPNSRVARMSFN